MKVLLTLFAVLALIVGPAHAGDVKQSPGAAQSEQDDKAKDQGAAKGQDADQAPGQASPAGKADDSQKPTAGQDLKSPAAQDDKAGDDKAMDTKAPDDKAAGKDGQTGGAAAVGAQTETRTDAGNVERVHGTVLSKEQEQLMLRTDTGRTITVDITNVSVEVRNAIQVNQDVTVVGFLGGDGNRMTAQSIQVASAGAEGTPTQAGEPKQDRDAAGQASPGAQVGPASERPMTEDDCKDGGWSRFNDLQFKNEGDCVSWVNRQERENRK